MKLVCHSVAVVRLVRRYWDLLGQPGRKVIISRQNAYHGSTMAGASLGGMAFMHEQGRLAALGRERGNRVPVLMLTAKGRETEVAKGLAAGSAEAT